jgi:hypothetical protein
MVVAAANPSSSLAIFITFLWLHLGDSVQALANVAFR